MPKLGTLKNERRKAEQEIVAMKARLRLLRDTAEQNEKKTKRDRKLKKRIETIKGDADWMAEEVENEFIRRDMQAMEKRMLTIEQRQQDAAYLKQSKQLVSEVRAQNARKQRDDLNFRLEAAYDQQQTEWERRRQLTEQGRKHAAWYKSVSSLAAQEFSSRNSELRQMAVAEEETRRWLVKEDRDQFLDALAIEEQRLKEARELRNKTAEDLKAYASGKAGSKGPKDLEREQLELHGFAPLPSTTSTRSMVPATSYQIAGPGMATVTRQQAPGVASMHRVHFPFAMQEQTNFAFEPPAPLRSHQQQGAARGGVFRRNAPGRSGHF